MHAQTKPSLHERLAALPAGLTGEQEEPHRSNQPGAYDNAL